MALLMWLSRAYKFEEKIIKSRYIIVFILRNSFHGLKIKFPKIVILNYTNIIIEILIATNQKIFFSFLFFQSIIHHR